MIHTEPIPNLLLHVLTGKRQRTQRANDPAKTVLMETPAADPEDGFTREKSGIQ